MFKLDNNFLVELGLGTLPAEEKNKMLAHIYETLEMRVGMRLAEKMSNEQLDEFESFINNNDEAGALKWLESNFPNYKQVVAEELEKLKSEIKQVAPQIVGQAQAMPSQASASVADPLPQSSPMAPPPQAPMQQPQPVSPQVPPMQNNFGMPLQQAPMQSAMQQPPMFDGVQQPYQQPLPPPPMPLDPLPQSSPMAPPPQAPMQQPQPVSPQVPPMQNNFGMPLQQAPMQSAMQQPPHPEQPGSVPAVPPPEYQQYIAQQPVNSDNYLAQPLGQANSGYVQQPPMFDGVQQPYQQPMSPDYRQQQNQYYGQQPQAQQPFPPSNEFPVEPAPVYIPPSEGVTEIPHANAQPAFDQPNQNDSTQPPQEPVVDQAPPLQFQPPVAPPKQPWQPPA